MSGFMWLQSNVEAKRQLDSRAPPLCCPWALLRLHDSVPTLSTLHTKHCHFEYRPGPCHHPGSQRGPRGGSAHCWWLCCGRLKFCNSSHILGLRDRGGCAPVRPQGQHGPTAGAAELQTTHRRLRQKPLIKRQSKSHINLHINHRHRWTCQSGRRCN